MSSTMDLQALSANASSALCGIWDAIGVQPAERAAFIDTLAASVAALYRDAVASQEQRLALLQGECGALCSTIEGMQRAMAEETAVPMKTTQTFSQYLEELESVRSALQSLWDSRETELKQLETQLLAVYHDVAEPAPPAFAHIGANMTTSRIQEYMAEIQRMTAVKTERANEITALCSEVLGLWEELAFAPAEGDALEMGIPQGVAGVGFAQCTIIALKTKVQELMEEKTVREERIAAIGREITHLWKRLQTPESEQTDFLESHAGIGDDTIRACEEYHAAKKAEFEVRVNELVTHVRTAIDELWNEMRAGPQQRQDMFAEFFTEGPFTDEMYATHEAYAMQLAAAVEDMRPILKGVEKREELKADKVEYEVITSDPSRLLVRGSSAARLREEKLERRVRKELPAVTKRLREQIKEWEARTGRGFFINDERYVDSLDAEEAADVKAREGARAARDAAKGGSAAAAATADAAKPAPAPGVRTGSTGRLSLYKPSTAAAAPGLMKRPSARAMNAAGSEDMTDGGLEGGMPTSGTSTAEAPASSAPAAASASTSAAAAPINARRVLGTSMSASNAAPPALPGKEAPVSMLRPRATLRPGMMSADMSRTAAPRL